MLSAVPQSDWSEDAAAGMLCISRSYLQKMYKQQFSVTFIDDVINARLLKAKLLLTTTICASTRLRSSAATTTRHISCGSSAAKPA